jgi:TonB family protein
MKSKNIVLLAASLLFSAGVFAQSTVETPAAGEEIQKSNDHLAIQDKQGKKEPPAVVEYDQAPELVKQFQPDYPDEAVKNKLEGLVWVSLWIDESGKVAEAKVTKTENEIFNQAAIDAGKQWIFKPAIAKGKPIAVWVTVPFRFTLHDGVKAPSPGIRLKERMTTPKSIPPDENAKVDQGPEPIKQVHPKYPADAKRDKVEGMVWTKLWVDEKGRVVDVTVTKSDNKMLDAAAIDAARQWSFKPALANGKPVAVWISLPFKFALK